MAKLTISDAARVAGVARSMLHRAIHAGRLSVDADGRLDTAELLRAGYTLQRSMQQITRSSLQDATLRASDAQHPRAPAENADLITLQQERDLLRLERDLLRQQLEAAQMREQAALEREREAREERQAAREREALLLRMVEQTQQRYDRLLEAPRPTATTPAVSHTAPSTRPPARARLPRGATPRRPTPQLLGT
jgi:hypothetical protein